jgi:hypothetical protein
MKRQPLEPTVFTQFVIPPTMPTLKDPKTGKDSEAGIVLNSIMSLLKSWSLTGLKKLSLGDGQTGTRAGNFNAVYHKFTSPSPADTAFDLPHDLGRIPVGFLRTFSDKACDVYAVDAAGWSDSVIKLKASAALASVTILLW